jgi:hypothetical protein
MAISINRQVFSFLSCSALPGQFASTVRPVIPGTSHIIVVPLTFKVHSTCKGKGKADLLQAWSGPEGSRKLRFPDFMTMAQDGGKVVSLKHRPPFPAGNTPGTHFC